MTSATGRRIAGLALACAWAGLGAWGCHGSHECAQEPTTVDDSRVRDVLEWMESHMDEQGIPGGALAIVDGDDTFVATLGRTARDGCAITPDTRFAIGSLNRTITNMALLAEARAQGIDLGDPVTDHLEDVPITPNEFGSADDVTIHHLLSWTAGIPQNDGYYRASFDCDETLEEWAEGPELAGGRPFELRFVPGELTTFTASEPILAARLLEELSGRDYPEAVDELVFTPLGMHTAEMDAPDAGLAPLAKGHVRTAGTELPEPAEMGCEARSPDMLAWLSANDAAALLEMLVHRETTIFDEDDLDRLVKVEGPGGPRYANHDMGYGLHSRSHALGTRAGWAAYGPGYKVSLEYYPDQDFGVFYAFNGIDLSLNPANDTNYRFHRRVLEAFFPHQDLPPCFCREHEACRVDTAPSCEDPADVARDHSAWEARYAGRYRSTGGHEGAIEVRWEEGNLVLTADGADGEPALVPVGLDAFTVHEGEFDRDVFAFTADESGTPRWLTVDVAGVHGIWVIADH